MKIRYCIFVWVIAFVAGVVIGWSQKFEKRVYHSPGPKIAIKEKHSGKLTGKGILPSSQPKVDGALVVSIPVSGVIRASYIDGQTGEQVGAGEEQVVGVTNVTIEGEKVETETTWEGQSEIAVVLPERHWAVEVGVIGMAVEWRKSLIRDWYIASRAEYDWRDGTKMDLRLGYEPF